MIFVTGANGQLGRNFCREYEATGVGRSQLDIADEADVRAVLERAKPSVIINCAAYTAVDAAEDDQETCFAVNESGVQNLAVVSAELGALLVHISSDYVFGASGESSRQPHSEDSPVSPQGVYAKSKLAGELQAATCPDHLIIRTCGLYGIGGTNFVETMLRLGESRDQLSIVNDQHCNPTSTASLVEAIMALIQSKQRGLFHVVNSPAMTWYEFAKEIFQQSQTQVELTAITSEQFGAKAPRPSYSALDTARYETATGKTLPCIKDALGQYLLDRRSA